MLKAVLFLICIQGIPREDCQPSVNGTLLLGVVAEILPPVGAPLDCAGLGPQGYIVNLGYMLDSDSGLYLKTYCQMTSIGKGNVG